MSATETIARPRGRVLIIDSDSAERSSIAAVVKTSGFTSESVASLTLGLERLQTASFELVIWGLASGDSRREEGVIELRLGGHCPLILVDTRYELGACAAIVVGADQVVAAPFTSETLEGAIRIGMRGPRSTSIVDIASRIEIVGVTFDVAERSIGYQGSTVVASRREWEVLAFLLGHPNQFFTVAEMVAQAWTPDSVSHEQARSAIGRLRLKLNPRGLPCSVAGNSDQGFGLQFHTHRLTAVAPAAE